jgi:cytochrome b
MMWIHPILQTLSIVFALYVLYLGCRRFAFAHLGKKGAMFPWKRHVQVGTAVMGTWFLVMLLGLLMAKLAWGATGVSGAHYAIALVMAPLILFGYFSGLLMDKRKARRTKLPLAHAVNNALLCLLAITQLVTGIGVIRDFMLP